ncbi:MAG: hypothetical protein V1887_00950 [Candidatus Aenigmatarchaeota archaeon]
MRSKGIKGVAQHTVWLVFGMILLVVTAALFYVMFPHSDCDRMAQVSAQEVRDAIECAAKYGEPTGYYGIKDPTTGMECNHATVRLCQESGFSIYGVGYVQNYVGLMVPEYMIYYQQFPTQQYNTLLQGGTWGFVESYPFERAYLGQRPYDVRPTLTQFKQFFYTNYLQKPCTEGQGLCFNSRGQEDVVPVGGTVTDVVLQRKGLSFAADNPKFYLVSPCYANVNFWKNFDGEIYARPDKLPADGSNYCYADENVLGGLMLAYAGEGSCEAGMIALDILSLGSKAAAEEGAKTTVKVTLKVVSKEIVKEMTEDIIKGAVEKGITKGTEKEVIKQVTERLVTKVTVREMNEETAKSAIEISVRAGVKQAQQLTGRELTPLAEKEIVEQTTEKILAESGSDVAETAMTRGIKEGYEKATLGLGETVTETESRTLAEAVIGDTVGEFGTEMGTNVAGGMRGLSSWSKASTVTKAFLNRYSTMEGLPTSKTETLLKTFAFLPCLDVDVCRSSVACVEAAMWPGMPWKELTSSKMKGTKPLDTVADVFTSCCIQYNYGAEKDTDKVQCTEPAELIDLVKPDLKVGQNESLNLTFVADYLGLKKTDIKNACSLSLSTNQMTCLDSMEMKARYMTDSCQASVSEHTYDFGEITHSNNITVMVRLYNADCPATLTVEISDDLQSWTPVSTMVAQEYPANNFLYIGGEHAFQYLRIREDGVCYFDSTWVVLDPLGAKVIQAAAGTEYPLQPGEYNYFMVPPGYSGTASKLCGSVNKCSVIAKWISDSDGWLKWAIEGDTDIGTDFTLTAGDKVGIYVEEASSVKFGTEVG